MSNQFLKHYGAWPTGFYIFQNRKLVWVSPVKQCTFFVEDLATALASFN